MKLSTRGKAFLTVVLSSAIFWAGVAFVAKAAISG